MNVLDIAGVLFAAGLVVYGLMERARLKRLAPPLVKVGNAPVGTYVRIVGRIVDGGTLVAPITGRACVSFDAVIKESTEPPKVVARGLRGTPFIVDDGTGKILVDPRGAFIHVVYDTSEVGPLDPEKVADPELLAPIGARRDALRFDEGVLVIGEQVTVTGLVSRAGGTDDDPVYRRLAATELRLTGAPDKPAVVSERPEDL
ncbi:MAG TPA: GIDE domain-containing protein [Kofleriaceae bacterium]|nr:GIDE domain-containing protein [Kofleriaceae bacterium]